MSFTANQGQTDPRVDFISRGNGYSLFLAGGEAVLTLRAPNVASSGKRPLPPLGARHVRHANPSTVVRLTPLHGATRPPVVGVDALPGKANYFIWHDPAKWRTNVPTYAKVRYAQVYPGVDLVYYGHQRQLEYDFIVAPGTDPRTIRLGVEGADQVEIDTNGDLVLHTTVGDIRDTRPTSVAAVTTSATASRSTRRAPLT